MGEARHETMLPSILVKDQPCRTSPALKHVLFTMISYSTEPDWALMYGGGFGFWLLESYVSLWSGVMSVHRFTVSTGTRVEYPRSSPTRLSFVNANSAKVAAILVFGCGCFESETKE